MKLINKRNLCTQKLHSKYLERYAELYSIMKTMPNDGRFNISAWGAPAQTECNTAACLAGHAGLHPWFRRRRFTLTPDSFGVTLITKSGQTISELVRDFFGFAGFGGRHLWPSLRGHPFDPKFYHTDPYNLVDGVFATHALIQLPYNPNTVEARQALRLFMEYFWPRQAVRVAIGKATSVYDMAAVHKNTGNWGSKWRVKHWSRFADVQP